MNLWKNSYIIVRKDSSSKRCWCIALSIWVPFGRYDIFSMYYASHCNIHLTIDLRSQVFVSTKNWMNTEYYFIFWILIERQLLLQHVISRNISLRSLHWFRIIIKSILPFYRRKILLLGASRKKIYCNSHVFLEFINFIDIWNLYLEKFLNSYNLCKKIHLRVVAWWSYYKQCATFASVSSSIDLLFVEKETALTQEFLHQEGVQADSAAVYPFAHSRPMMLASECYLKRKIDFQPNNPITWELGQNSMNMKKQLLKVTWFSYNF